MSKTEYAKKKLTQYARVDFEVAPNDIDKVIKAALSLISQYQRDNDEILWESLDLILIPNTNGYLLLPDNLSFIEKKEWQPREKKVKRYPEINNEHNN